jgi:FkbM family methyltransferase
MLFSRATALVLHNLGVHLYLPYRFPGGRIYLDVAESRMMLARALGRYEVRKRRALGRFLKKGQTFVDAGANKGDFSLIAARCVGPAGRVLAFEPEPGNFQWITKSVELNRYQNVRPFRIALSDRNGTASLYLGKMSGWHSLLPGSSGVAGAADNRRERLVVPTRTLDAVLREQPDGGRVDVIKIDVEGAEMNVLRGAAEALDRNDNVTVLIDIHPEHGIDSREICDYLREKGFALFKEAQPFTTPVRDFSTITSLVARRSAA